MLADQDIVRAQVTGAIGITPWDPGKLGPASYDVTLDRWYRRMKSSTKSIDVINIEAHTDLFEAYEGKIILQPQDFILATTVERLTLGPNIVSRVEGRSSIGRLGILVHVTAGFIDPGFSGQVTFEIVNLSGVQVTLRAGMRIAQLGFSQMSRDALQPYKGSYQKQEGPTESRFRLV